MSGEQVRNKKLVKTKNPINNKKPAFRRSRNENRLGMSMAALAIFMMVVVVGINSYSLKQKQETYMAREQELLKQIEEQMNRTEELKELEVYTKTKKYAEEVAKDKLGLVYENEIIFKETD